MKTNTYQLSMIIFALLALLFVASNAQAKSGATRYSDTCKVIANSGGVLIEGSAQYQDVAPGSDISQACLDFAKSVSATVCDFVKDNGNVQIFYNRWFKPGTDELKDHCHYKCMGDADSGCEATCSKKPVQLGTNIGTLPCSKDSSNSKKSK